MLGGHTLCPLLPLAHIRGAWPQVACTRSAQSLIEEQEASGHVLSYRELPHLLKISEGLHATGCLGQRCPVHCSLESGPTMRAACARAIWPATSSKQLHATGGLNQSCLVCCRLASSSSTPATHARIALSSVSLQAHTQALAQGVSYGSLPLLLSVSPTMVPCLSYMS